MKTWRLLLGGALAVGVAVGAGCTGNIGDTAPGTSIAALDTEPSRWRRLTKSQYRHAVKDLLGVDADVSGFLEDTKVTNSPFPANAGIQPQDLDIENYWRAAETVAAAVDVDGLVDCVTIDEVCAGDFIDGFGRRAYRRPVTAEQREALLEVFRAGRKLVDQDGEELDDPSAGIRLVIQAMLQSGAFVYLAEYGTDEGSHGAVRPLDGYELAARLSFLLWNTTPDDELLGAAADGSLGTEEGLLAQADRLMASDRFIDALVEFHITMLGIEEVFESSRSETELTSDLRAAMYHEAEQYIHDVMAEEGTIVALLTTQATYPDAELAAIYGVGGDGTKRDGLGTRFGVLTLPAFLVATPPLETEFTPTYRGGEIRTRLSCDPIPAPVIDIEFEDLGDVTPRERLLQHKDNPTCASCHELMDPLGFPLENYDDIGRWQDDYAYGEAVDASGYYVVQGAPGGPVEIDGPATLGTTLAAQPQVRQCFAVQWFRHAFARHPEARDDGSLAPMMTAFERGDGDVRAGIRAMIVSPAFRLRRAEEGQQ